VSYGILIKLLNVSAFVPISILIGWRIWGSRRESSDTTVTTLKHVLLGVTAAILTALVAFIPFLGSANTLIDQVVKFHLAAENLRLSRNLPILNEFFRSNGTLSIAAMTGAILAIVRHDWRVIPLVAWLAATIAILVLHAPLFAQHAVCLIPPLVAITVLGLSDLPSVARVREIMAKRMSWIETTALLMGLLVCAATIKAMPTLYAYYRTQSARVGTTEVRQTARIAADLRQVTTPDQWVITDGQFIAALADRDTPPALVDTSFVRILSGYLTTQQLIEAASDPRVHIVMFATRYGSFGTQLPDFHGWVAQHFTAVHSHGPAIDDPDIIELWVSGQAAQER
jgi:hypothetical protein